VAAFPALAHGIKRAIVAPMNKPVDVPVLIRERDGEIAILVLNRRQARNSLSEAVLKALSSALSEIKDDRSVRAVVLAANGGRSYFRHIMTTCSAMMQQIVTLPQPVIAAVQGAASAAGCQLVSSCDLAIASEAARFATPGVDIGLFCSTPMVALSRNVARKHAMEMLLTGEMVEAKRAAEIGLVNRAVPAGEERAAAIELAKQIASKSSYTLKVGKEAFYRQLELPLAEAYAYASEVMTENMMARDAEEGICAFIEKRDAKWQDR
jgi:enoyl-CoA hydratase/carnithine racemase